MSNFSPDVSGTSAATTVLSPIATQVLAPGAARRANTATPTPTVQLVSAQQAQPDKPVDPAQLRSTIDKANQYLLGGNSQIRFEIDQDSSRLVTQVVDAKTRELLLQLPSKEALKLAEAIASLFTNNKIEAGGLVKTKA